MDLEAWSSSVSNLVQAAAILIGGAWAYQKFVRGRTFRYRAHLAIKARLLDFEKDPVLRVQLVMRNEGLSKTDLSLQDEKQVVVRALSRNEWWPDVNIEWDESKAVARTRLFQAHTWLEPGETIEDDLLIPVGGDDRKPIAYRVRAIVKAPRGGVIRSVIARLSDRPRKLQVWTIDLIVPVTLREGRAVSDEGDGGLSDESEGDINKQLTTKGGRSHE